MKNTPRTPEVEKNPRRVDMSLDYEDVLRKASLDKNILYIRDEVDDYTAYLKALELQYLQNKGCKEVRVKITSPGGNVFAGLAIYDSLMEFKRNGGRVITEASGYAASMGAILLQAGDERIATKNTRILIHEVADFAFFSRRTASDAEDQAKELNKVNSQLIEILSKRSNLSISKIKALIKKKDFWMSTKEALEYGFIDKII